MSDILIRGAKVWNGSGFAVADVAISGEMIAAVGSVSGFNPERVVEAEGLWLMPGLVDVHVHLREPGFSSKETILSGTRAAARGGFTTVCPMPNLSPAPDSMEGLEAQLEIIRRDAQIGVLPFATITRGRKGRGEVVDIAALAPYVAGFSDDGSGVSDAGIMEEAMWRVKECDSIIAAHCEVDDLVRGGVIHDGEFARRNGIPGICSESEWKQIERDLKLVEKTGCRYHVCHISTKEAVELIRDARKSGLRASCETGPHYLTMTDEDIADEGRFKMNPPIRTRADRDALVAGVADGTVEVIATDHAPHTADQKSRGVRGSAFGITGIETSLPIIYTHLVERGIISLERMVDAMSLAPRRLFKLGGGVIAAGERADLLLADLDSCYTIDSTKFLSMGKSTPFEGWKVKGESAMTIYGGKIVYER